MNTYEERINNLKDWYELHLKWKNKIANGEIMPWNLDFANHTAEFYLDCFLSTADEIAIIYQKDKQNVIHDAIKLAE